MSLRIVLSSLLLFVCAAASCAEQWSADDEADRDLKPYNVTCDAGATDNGIGTSPSLVPDAGAAK